MEKKITRTDIMLFIVIILLIANLLVSLLGKPTSSGEITSPEQRISEMKAWEAYRKDIGSKNISVTNDKISKSEYSSYIIGDVNNKSNEAVEDVSIIISFYKNNVLIETSSEHIMLMPPKATLPMEVYAPDDFDTYSIDYISGVIYE